MAQGCCQLVLHSSTKQEPKRFALNPAAGYLCSVKTQLYEQWIFIGVNAVAQGCCHLVLHSSTKKEPKHFALTPAAGIFFSVKTQLYEQWIFIGVNAVAQGCCHLVLHSSTEPEPKHFALNPEKSKRPCPGSKVFQIPGHLGKERSFKSSVTG